MKIKILFVRYRNIDQLFTMNANGSGQTKLVPNTNEVFDPVGPTWSPDSTKIAFSAWSSATLDHRLFVANGDGSNPTPLPIVSAGEYAWSPDGTKIAYVAAGPDNSDIFVANADGTAQTNLTNTPSRDANPDWSPDGTKIVFAANTFPSATTPGRKSDVFVMDADGSNRTRITNNLASDNNPIYSPNGARIAFVSGRDGDAEIYTIDALGGDLRRVTQNSIADLDPTWQPIPH